MHRWQTAGTRVSVMLQTREHETPITVTCMRPRRPPPSVPMANREPCGTRASPTVSEMVTSAATDSDRGMHAPVTVSISLSDIVREGAQSGDTDQVC
jgi:hypothetical protein